MVVVVIVVVFYIPFCTDSNVKKLRGLSFFVPTRKTIAVKLLSCQAVKPFWAHFQSNPSFN